MSISLLLEMASSSDPDRVAVVYDDVRLTAGQLSDLVDRAASVIGATGARHVAYVGVGGVLQPLLIFASAQAAIPYAPLNYRLSPEGINELLARLPEPLVIVDPRYRQTIGDGFDRVMTSNEFLAVARAATTGEAVFADPESVAITLFTSGTTSKPKAVELTHTNITSYITGTVDFGSASPDDASLICVPPYHIAGVNAAMSNLYAGRKMVYLANFDARDWVRSAAAEQVTHATVVPTMLDRIIAVVEQDPVELPALRHLAYGGSKVPLPLVRKALKALPHVAFVNAYGLTETSSTIAVLTGDDHREAFESTDPAVSRRLASVGRPISGIELEVRDHAGAILPTGQSGELYVRGDQVSGRYTGIGSVLDEHGWFATKDLASIDEAGYLFINGRSDDTIIRGGENIAPAEVEDVLVEHPDVRQVAVVGVDDLQWGQAMVAVVVLESDASPDPDHLRTFVRDALRGSRTPDRIVFSDALPATPTGKVLRREIVAGLLEDAGQGEASCSNATRTGTD
jgi:acyl-CoA synthetase (AMP-forming)/AMP-acid ligase II